MKIKCEHCGAEISDLDVKCPYCRGENIHYKKENVSTYNANNVPQTIEELKQWYIAMNLPDENVTRFFIGKDYKRPKAFGIYKDERTGNFIVYKNKGDGERAVRYEGKDEAYAVNELYKKLKDEIYNQKHNNQNTKIRNNYRSKNRNNNNNYKDSEFYKNTTPLYRFFYIVIAAVSIIGISAFFLFILFGIRTPNQGYYRYNDSYYYYQSGRWYEYDDYYGWRRAYVDDYFEDNYDYYYDSGYYDYDYDIDRFEDSSYYSKPSSSSSSSSYDYDSSYDSDSSWDSSDSWDSSSTDWDSDW